MAGVEAYEGKYGCEAVVCMVVQPGEKNTFDQRLLEHVVHAVNHEPSPPRVPDSAGCC